MKNYKVLSAELFVRLLKKVKAPSNHKEFIVHIENNIVYLIIKSTKDNNFFCLSYQEIQLEKIPLTFSFDYETLKTITNHLPMTQFIGDFYIFPIKDKVRINYGSDLECFGNVTTPFKPFKLSEEFTDIPSKEFNVLTTIAKINSLTFSIYKYGDSILGIEEPTSDFCFNYNIYQSPTPVNTESPDYLIPNMELFSCLYSMVNMSYATLYGNVLSGSVSVRRGRRDTVDVTYYFPIITDPSQFEIHDGLVQKCKSRWQTIYPAKKDDAIVVTKDAIWDDNYAYLLDNIRIYQTRLNKLFILTDYLSPLSINKFHAFIDDEDYNTVYLKSPDFKYLTLISGCETLKQCEA